ncbi:DoxX family membrane protein [Nonomuraea sp. NPDC050663]|uniref:DoxX family membrane protein n=1 Tax=Nonomuraea sp. NPDC050663 TaxID=3364370 RepID=UPI003787C7FB
MTVKQALHDIAALVARLGVGGIFFANGWLKLEEGLRATGRRFAEQGAPVPDIWATVTMMTELIGGALLIAGLVVSVTGLVLFVEALAVFLIARPLNPVDINEIILLGVAALLLAVVGAGRVSVDHMVVIRRRESAAEAEFAADRDADAVIDSLREPDDPRRASPQEQPTEESPPTVESPRPPRQRRTGESRKPDEFRSEDPGLEDTAPHPLPADKPAPGDTLVAGRKKPSTRTRTKTDE